MSTNYEKYFEELLEEREIPLPPGTDDEAFGATGYPPSQE